MDEADSDWIEVELPGLVTAGRGRDVHARFGNWSVYARHNGKDYAVSAFRNHDLHWTRNTGNEEQFLEDIAEVTSLVMLDATNPAR